MDRVRNEVRSRAGMESELASRADKRVLRWFGHVERMDEFPMVRRVLMAEVSGRRVRGRPRLGWMDVVKMALGHQSNLLRIVAQPPPSFLCCLRPTSHHIELFLFF